MHKAAAAGVTAGRPQCSGCVPALRAARIWARWSSRI